MIPVGTKVIVKRCFKITPFQYGGKEGVCINSNLYTSSIRFVDLPCFSFYDFELNILEDFRSSTIDNKEFRPCSLCSDVMTFNFIVKEHNLKKYICCGCDTEKVIF